MRLRDKQNISDENKLFHFLTSQGRTQGNRWLSDSYPSIYGRACVHILRTLVLGKNGPQLENIVLSNHA